MAETTDRAPPASPGGQTQKVEAMIRVDHAGEFGAVQIYRGQRAVFERIAGKEKAAALIADMEEGEKAHLETFDRLVRERRVRPTALAPLWHVAGFGLGAVTALMGEKAAHACTAAVEEVIEGHYGAQASALGESEPELKSTIEKFRADEIGHRDTAIENGAHEAPAYPLLSAAIKLGCRIAIRASEIV
ncbi:MAG: demethoxyubiquinone hydroxylase family protein [Alphaproteobacteria bacterium]